MMITIISSGSEVSLAMKASEELMDNNINVRVILCLVWNYLVSRKAIQV